MPYKGEVYYSEKFKFYDGEIGQKLFIVLNNPSGTEPYIVAKTTSQPIMKYNLGCNPGSGIFFIKSNMECFPKDTFIQLIELYPFTNKDFLSGHFEVSLKKIDNLSELCFRQIINCIKRMKDDIPQQYYKLIVE